jgi:rRNA-processing protein FCF1
MQQVLVDACGWVACVDAQLNVERELEALVGPCEWILLSSVARELERLEQQRPRSKSLLLPLLLRKATLVEGHDEAHTDDALVAHAQELGCATLTVDVNLKHRLFEANLSVIEVRQGNHLYLLDSL